MKLLENGNLTTTFDDDCPGTREILSLVGDKWSALVVVNLGQGKLRFSQLKRALNGISQRVLTQTLRNLERHGLLARRVIASTPIRVEYELTGLGVSLLQPISALALWAHQHKNDIKAARAAYESSTAGAASRQDEIA